MLSRFGLLPIIAILVSSGIFLSCMERSGEPTLDAGYMAKAVRVDKAEPAISEMSSSSRFGAFFGILFPVLASLFFLGIAFCSYYLLAFYCYFDIPVGASLRLLSFWPMLASCSWILIFMTLGIFCGVKAFKAAVKRPTMTMARQAAVSS